jgi:hypothetical protein
MEQDPEHFSEYVRQLEEIVDLRRKIFRASVDMFAKTTVANAP